MSEMVIFTDPPHADRLYKVILLNKGIVALRPYLGLTFQSTGIARGQAQTLFATALNFPRIPMVSLSRGIKGYLKCPRAFSVGKL